MRPRRLRPVLAWLAVLGLAGCGALRAPATAPRSVSPGAAEVEALLSAPAGGGAAAIPEGCHAPVRAVLLGLPDRDALTDARSTCAGALREATRRLAPDPRTRFGLVDRWAVELTGISLVLGEAHRCSRWPLRSPGVNALNSPAAQRAGCRTRRWSGELPIYAVRTPDEGGGLGTQGQRSPVAPVLVAKVPVREGVARVDFAALAQQVEGAGAGALWEHARIELGEAGWAGRVDLQALQRIVAAYHLQWVGQGWGSPGLFVAAHAVDVGGAGGRDDAGALPEASTLRRTGSAPLTAPDDDALAATIELGRALAFDALLRRQARDYAEVVAGAMRPATFLERHVRSPYRASVLRLAMGEED